MRPPAAHRWARATARAGVLLLVTVLLAGCLIPPQPRTGTGQDVFNLYVLVLALATLVFVAVEGFIVYAIIRYRRRPGDDVLPEQHHGNTPVEILWTAIPSVLVLILFVMSVITLQEVEARVEEPGLIVEVDAFQWSWIFRYPNGYEATPQGGEPPVLALPVGEPVRLHLNSSDVIHAWFVPEFLIKRDIVPVGEVGNPNDLEFVITEAGTYTGQCAEFCGGAHADMIFIVEAMERDEFDAYIDAQARGETPPPTAGEGECGTIVELAAVPSIRFDRDELEVPAGEEFCIEFTNEDVAIHDVGIYVDNELVFDGEDIREGETITYVVPALEAGEHRFICTLHPQEMVGDLTASE